MGVEQPDLALVHGINILNFMNATSDRESICSLQLRPVFNPEIPDYGGLVPFNAWAKRMLYICSVGMAVRDVAVFVPYTDIWLENEDVIERFEKIAERLEDCAADFDFIDGEFSAIERQGAVIEIVGTEFCVSVSLNGEKLGTRVMSPYRFEIPGNIVKNENRVAITVSTTAAGALCEGLAGKNLPFSGPYNERCLEFERDSDLPIKFTCRVGQ